MNIYMIKHTDYEGTEHLIKKAYPTFDKAKEKLAQMVKELGHPAKLNVEGTIIRKLINMWDYEYYEIVEIEVESLTETQKRNNQNFEAADMLDSLQARQNNGRGVTCVRSIVHYLRNNDFDSAKAVWSNDGDKIRQYPEVEVYCISIFGKR